MKKYYLLFAITLLSNAFAASQSHYPFLSGGINIKNYNLCNALITQCPRDGMIPKQSCVQRILETKKQCHQFIRLSHILDMPATMLHIRKIGNLALLRIHFIADGQNWYQIITPQGNIIDTKIDPRTIDKALKKKHKDRSFLILNWDRPTLHINDDGLQTVTNLLKINDSCVACPTIGWAKIKFIFNRDGSLQKTDLVSFKQT